MRSEPTRRLSWKPARTALRDQEPGEQIHWLVDNRDAYQALLAAIRGARSSISISQLAFDVDCIAYEESGAAANGDGESLFEVIVEASRKHRVKVRVLLNSSILVNTQRALARAVAKRAEDPRLFDVRGLNRFPQLLHAKMVLVDSDRAFLMGSPFVNGYWDTEAHPPVDPRRPRRELGGRGVHDVSVEVTGLAVRDLANCFSHLWINAERGGAKPRSILPAKEPHTSTRFIRAVGTEPKNFAGRNAPGSTETLAALLDGIGRAKSLLYLEHQYLSSRPVVNALRDALKRQPSLEIVMLLNQNADVTAYRAWQRERLRENGLLGHPRVGIFALWTIGDGERGRRAINQVFVHSKVVVVDDRWALVGSANLDGASLNSYGDDFTGRLARRVFRDVRNFDVSLVVQAENRMPGTINPVRALRERLWSEHLGDDGTDGFAAVPHVGLGAWQETARKNAGLLNAIGASDPGLPRKSFVLPYSAEARPRAQLAEAGVALSKSIDLQFDPGWVERNLSPNWFRNMFG